MRGTCDDTAGNSPKYCSAKASLVAFVVPVSPTAKPEPGATMLMALSMPYCGIPGPSRMMANPPIDKRSIRPCVAANPLLRKVYPAAQMSPYGPIAIEVNPLLMLPAGALGMIVHEAPSQCSTSGTLELCSGSCSEPTVHTPVAVAAMLASSGTSPDRGSNTVTDHVDPFQCSTNDRLLALFIRP